MSGRLRIVQVNAAFDPAASDPDALLDRYPTLTGWSEALTAAGADVTVVQRYRHSAAVVRQGVRYQFVEDGAGAIAETGDEAPAIVGAVAAGRPAAVHVNGLMFPGLVSALRRDLDHAVAIVVQDHAGARPPTRGSRWLGRRWPAGLDEADAVSFTSAGQAEPWRLAGILRRARILEIVEASTRMTAVPRDEARRATGLAGAPLLLWVGRLDANKDPLTVLDGLDRALTELPDARVALIWHANAPLEPAVRAAVSASPRLAPRVTLVGPVPHGMMGHYYGAADAFISGSHTEGSGYALIEALACGLTPIVTDIPPFRAIAGPCGVRWPAGEAKACAAAITRVCRTLDDGSRAAAREHFTTHLSWRALAERTLAAYRALIVERQSGRGDT